MNTDNFQITLSDFTAAQDSWLRDYWPWWGDERAFEATMAADARIMQGSEKCSVGELTVCLLYNGTEKCCIIAMSLLKQLAPWIHEASYVRVGICRASNQNKCYDPKLGSQDLF